jgi:hypothetical protein
MKRRFVGHYYLNGSAISLWLREGDGAEFESAPGKRGDCAKIEIGWSDQFWDILNRLLHEANEFVLTDMCSRYYDRLGYPADTGGYLFVMDHHKFTLMNQFTGYFLSQCLDDLKKAWRNWDKKPKSKKKRKSS